MQAVVVMLLHRASLVSKKNARVDKDVGRIEMVVTFEQAGRNVWRPLSFMLPQ